MQVVDEHLAFIEDQLSEGKLLIDTTDVYTNALRLQELVDQKEYEYQDIIQSLLSLLEHGYDVHSMYDKDIVDKAKRLSNEA